MRSFLSVPLVLTLSLSLLVRSGGTSPVPGPGNGNAPGNGPLNAPIPSPPSPPGVETTIVTAAETTVTESVTRPSTTTLKGSTSTVRASTTTVQGSTSTVPPLTTTIQGSAQSVVTRTIAASTVTRLPTSIVAEYTVSVNGSATPSTSIVVTSMAMALSTAESSTQSYVAEHRTLIIVLSTVLGFISLVLMAAVAFLLYRYRKGRTPFSNRGISPIDDEEIESWRQAGTDQKRLTAPPDHGAAVREVSSGGLVIRGWTWNASPTSIRTVSASLDSPTFIAKAPNAREGLTDDRIPGAQPFIEIPKRQSSRLYKAPPGHSRSKSRRSSMSAKSIWSINSITSANRASSDVRPKEDRSSTWYDPDSESGSRHLTVRSEYGTSSPETSIFDGLSVAGGLSPRPKSVPRLWNGQEIGRAIA